MNTDNLGKLKTVYLQTHMQVVNIPSGKTAAAGLTISLNVGLLFHHV